MKKLLFILVVVSVKSTLGKNLDTPPPPLTSEDNEGRGGRWFGYRYTSTVVDAVTVTSLLPSSCVHVQPSLPPCRNVRHLDTFPQFAGTRQLSPAGGRSEGGGGVPVAMIDGANVAGLDDADNHRSPPPTIHSTSLGWGEYLGLYAPTVTLSTVHLDTVTVLDPRVVVTFSVKGCKPSRLPMDLAECAEEAGDTPAVLLQPTGVVANQQVITSTVVLVQQAGNAVDNDGVMDDTVTNNMDLMQSEKDSVQEIQKIKATTPLDDVKLT